MLIVLGMWLYMRSLSGISDYAKEYGVVEEDYVTVQDDSDEVVEEITVSDDSYSAGGEADESLMDIVYDKDYVLNGSVGLNEMKIGRNYDNLMSSTGSINTPLKARGAIEGKDVEMRCWLTEEDEIHGVYRHENGTTLDANGYIKSNGDLYIQLGHASEKSEWRLSPVSDEMSETYRYEGTWGKRDKPFCLVFTEEVSY